MLPSFYGWFGLIVSMSFMYYTYIYIGTAAAISKFDVQLEEAAQSLGTAPVQSRLKVMLPVILQPYLLWHFLFLLWSLEILLFR